MPTSPLSRTTPLHGASRLALTLAIVAVSGGAVFAGIRWLGQPQPVEACTTSLPLPERPTDEDALEMFAFGDAGTASEARERVIGSMVRLAGRVRPDFCLMLGDNFYPSGVRSVEDDAWQRQFGVYAAAGLAVPFWVALGNHDYMGNVQAQIEYGGRNELWRMPSPYYCFEEPVGRASVAFFVIDTQPLRLGDFVGEAQLRWLDERLSESRAQWKIVLGHHPMLSHGNHGGSSTVLGKVGPLLDAHGVDLYLSGHDHDLQLLDSGGSWLQVVSGAAATRRPTGAGEGTLFACNEFGFAWIEVRESSLTVGFVSETGELRYRHTIEKPLHLAARLDEKPAAN